MNNLRIPALKVNQWLRHWDDVDFSSSAHRRKPEPSFYLFNIPAVALRRLSGIQQRTTAGGLLRSADLGIQRRHDVERSHEIGEFVKFGFPWSELSDAKRQTSRYDDLKKPGWLPTAIVVNILRKGDTRRGRSVAAKDLVHIKEVSGAVTIVLPDSFNKKWAPTELPPFEIIDGQHRLGAFSDDVGLGEYELPVVAFDGLDISWQAYLFYTINIKPKRISTSLAYDMYPLLRTEDWLQRVEDHPVYRETRAQELTAALWSYTQSPWRNRINMLGEPGKPWVSQSAWIRSLLATYVRPFEGPRIRIGGLFGAPVGKEQLALPWSLAQQAAFLICVWRKVEQAVANTHGWADDLRQGQLDMPPDPAFAGPNTLLNQDQGVRAILYLSNDLTYVQSEALKLDSWALPEVRPEATEATVQDALTSLERQKVAKFLGALADLLAAFDWRSASAPRLSDTARTEKLAFRGSGGYSELRRQLVKFLTRGTHEVADAARKVGHLLKV